MPVASLLIVPSPGISAGMHPCRKPGFSIPFGMDFSLKLKIRQPPFFAGLESPAGGEPHTTPSPTVFRPSRA
jgi:hypothetical protein